MARSRVLGAARSAAAFAGFSGGAGLGARLTVRAGALGRVLWLEAAILWVGSVLRHGVAMPPAGSGLYALIVLLAASAWRRAAATFTLGRSEPARAQVAAPAWRRAAATIGHGSSV